jgi:DNA polymerase-3 subunit epsilon
VSEGFEIQEEFQCLVRIEGRVPRHITQITGIHDRMLQAEGKALPDVLRQVHDFSCGRLAFAHNARFDRSFLNAAAQRLGWRDEFVLECSIPVFKQLLPGRRGYGLSAVAECLKVRSGVAHRALADCRMLVDCLKRAHG